MEKPQTEETMATETDEDDPSIDEDYPSIDEDEPSSEEEPLMINLKQPKKRRAKRKYVSDYLQLGFTWNGDEDDPRPQCVLCGRLLANESMRPNKLRRHIEAKHPHMQDKPVEFYKTQLKELKISKKKVLPNNKVNEKAMHASYHISLRIAKAGKPHTIGESSVLPVIKDAVGVMFSDKSSKEVETIPLSNSTVARRIDEMSQWVEEVLIQRVGESRFFSLLLDESTDVGGLCQLLVFVRYLWNNEPHEDMLCCLPIVQSAGEEIFQTLNSYVQKKGLDWMKCVGICTDGARVMCGKKSSVVTRVLEVCPNASWTHCNIHREALVSRSMSGNLQNVLNTSIKIVNCLKSKSLQPRLFEKLCEEMGGPHTSLFLHTESRWLSRGKVLTRLVELREDVAMLLDDKSDLVKWLRNKEFMLALSYLADVFSKLNELNLYLQVTEGDDVFAVHDKIRGFVKKLALWKKNVEGGKYDCFDTFQTFIIENEVYPSYGIIMEISAHLNALKEDFECYFEDEVKKCEQKGWVANPFQGNAMTGISLKADEELVDLSKDTASKLNFNCRKLTHFWLSVQETFPTLSAEALKVLLPFSTSYTCELGFSAMVGIKNRFRNKLQLPNSLRLKITNIDVDINAVINSNRKQAHPSHKPHLEKQI